VRAAAWGQVGGLVATAVAAPVLTPSPPAAPALGWGGLSGAGTGLAMAFLFRAMSRGALSVVVPVSAVGGIALPVLVGTVLLGERPGWPTWLGIGLAVPALWVVSGGARRPAAGSVRDGLVAGAGIAVQYVALARAGADAGLWPVLAGRVTALAAVTVLAATLLRGTARPAPVRVRLTAAGAGILAAVALTAYLYAVHTGYVTVAVVLSSLYPVVPVVAGIVVFRERIRVRQAAGLVAALAAAVLIALP
jgi:drug/metabolite transporter (DMT)-like permease